jgi:hypothetical protein
MASGSRRSHWLVLLGVAITSGLLAHCGAADNESDGGTSIGGTFADATLDTAESSPDVPVVPDGSGGQPYHESCGVVTCVPDQPLSCAAFGSSAGAGGVGGAGASSGAAGAPVDPGGGAPGAAGMGGVGGASEGGASAEGGSAGAEGDGASGAGQGGLSSGGAPSAPEYSCQVTLKSTGPIAECQLAGTGAIDDPCFSTQECGPGLACVLDGAAPRCRPFCCAGDSSCTQDSYCDERPLAGDAGTVLEVPVCVPAYDCSLLEPYPCEGDSCTCPPGEACIVVRSDGTTTCAEPGLGELGDACPCAWGHVCSAANQCLLLCETGRAEHYCGNAKCQASAELPDGWGVCVGPSPDASR